MRTWWRTTVASVAALAIVIPGAAGAAPPTGGATTPTNATHSSGTTHTITLVTGDVARLTTFPDGRQDANVERDPSRPAATYRISRRDGDVYLTPADVLPLVASGRVDPQLFNLTDLVAQGYDDARQPTLPLLVAGAPGGPGKRVAAPAAPPGTTANRQLPSIGAVAVSEDKRHARTFWKAVATGPTTLSAGVQRVWLDRKVRANLDDSVPRIGAPAAWTAGYTGRGVKVAVLDSGYDPDHRDLAGRVATAKNFTSEPDATDTFGHGTHVAATIAGSGTAGRAGARGVAPDADLIVGKVLDQHGSGNLSAVIAGMEWAVAQGARIVNVSLGAPAAEGPDPVTEAVDSLTASSGALFVVSAGNSGPDVQTLGTPGTADRALTVGAVSKADELASFSSRGPRLGDGAAKPEITAPGVDIVAARAAGTSLGQIVDRSYTSMSGTSMSAPHVTGAAALLAQRHPDWRADQLKSALVATAAAVTDAPVWAQGAGRVDVPAALDPPVTVDRASVAFGRLPAGGKPVTTRVTYRNTRPRPVTANLSVAATDAGAAARPAALSVTPTRLTIPAGGEATATVRLDPAATAPNLYTGLLTARAAGRTLRTPVGLAVTAPTHTLTVAATDRDGNPARGFASNVEVWNLDTGESYYGFFREDGPATLDVPAGRYALTGWIFSLRPDGTEKDISVLSEPELTVDGDRTVRLDARRATEIRIDLPEPTVAESIGLAWQRETAARSLLSGMMVDARMVRRVYATPTRPVRTGTYQFFSRWDLAKPPLTATVAGQDGFGLADPRPIPESTLIDGTRELRLVDGGAGTPADLDRPDVRGAAVLVRYQDFATTQEQIRAAADAGVHALLLAPDEEVYGQASAWGLPPLPTYFVGTADAGRLRDRLAAGPVELVLRGQAVTPYRYDLLLPEPGRIPADLHYTRKDLALAIVDSEFHSHAPDMLAVDRRAGYPPGVDVAFSTGRWITRPHRRVDHVNTGVLWRTTATLEGSNLGGGYGTMYGPLRELRAGDRAREVWFPALTRPAVPQTLPSYAYGLPANRFHDAIRVAIPQYADGAVTQYGWFDGQSDRARLTLRQGSRVVGTADASSAQFTVGRGGGTYRLTLDVSRDQVADEPWWTTSTATSSTWRFRSERPTGDKPAMLPLLQVGYDIDTDLTNTVRADRPYPLRLDPGYQPGATGRGRFAVTVQVSYDDAGTWLPVKVDRGDGFTAIMPAAPAGAEFASVRVSVRDAGGNRLDQTISRAWKVTR
ncbi:S8 family serine peptidase [Plantactinospora sp. GCM10030261]|uniref:S8 family serine peptidase n=1 Tax=Plantactinospora sp. GCM10030261 TaxID=3273420 RepID=UPI003616C66F